MESNALWLTPLILLPGVALLIMATSARYGQVHADFQSLSDLPEEVKELARELLFKRSALFRNTLISLYISVGLLACSSLLGGLVNLWLSDYAWTVAGLTCLGIASLVFAAIELIRESLLSMVLMEEQGRQLENGEQGVENR